MTWLDTKVFPLRFTEKRAAHSSVCAPRCLNNQIGSACTWTLNLASFGWAGVCLPVCWSGRHNGALLSHHCGVWGVGQYEISKLCHARNVCVWHTRYLHVWVHLMCFVGICIIDMCSVVHVHDVCKHVYVLHSIKYKHTCMYNICYHHVDMSLCPCMYM